MESLFSRTAKTADPEALERKLVGAEKQAKKEAKLEARRKLKEARRGLSREEYEKWAQQQSAVETDFEAALKNRIAELEKQASETTNEFLLAQLESRISQTQMLLETEQASRAGERTAQEMEEAEQFVIQEAALQRGPLVSQRMKWWFGDQWGRCARLINAWRSGLSSVFSRTTAAIGRWYGPALPILSIMTMLGGVAAAITLAATSGLGLNLGFVLLASIVLMFVAFVDEWTPGKVRRTIALIMMLAFYSTSTFVWSVAPSAGYAGARRQQGQIVEALDSRDWFLRPPAFWRGETMEWVDLTNPGSRGDSLYPGSFRQDLVSKSGLLKCELALVPRREGFKELFETGRTPESYRQELLQQVQGFIDGFTGKSTMEDLNTLKYRIALLPDNHLFEIAESRVRLRQ